MYDLANRYALIAGSSRGIGRGIAAEMARAGCGLVMTSRSLRSAQAAAEEMRSMGREAIGLHLDVSDVASVERCVAEAIRHFGRIDILVNNAGIFQSKLGLELSDADFNHCLDVNLTGMWRMTKALAPHFRAHGGGRIINIASVGGRLGVGFAPAYCASKAGVISLTQSLAFALGADNINVNCICPGAVHTAMQEGISSLKTGSKHVETSERTPLTGPLTAEDIGQAVVFFASSCSRHITGQALNVDCGFIMS